MLCSFKLLPVL
uniref:Uncharacterized protein n=1 Tax=Moniliophthora roreri TaxID=221103 RepID=A0A0W0GCV7_MONRR